MQEMILKCTDLSKTYDDGKLYVEVLRKVNLQIMRREMVAILGPSGSGKSTLLHLLGGLDKPTLGSVQIFNTEITKLSETKKGRLRNKYLGFVYQFHHLLPEFNALENVAMPLLIRGESVKTASNKAHDLLSRVGLSDRKDHHLGELSGGERQRVAIARALVTAPAVVLADEPTGNLDHKTASTIYDLLCKLKDELGTSFVIVTHDLAWASRMDRVLHLDNGELYAFKQASV